MTRKEELENRIRSLTKDMAAALREALRTPDIKKRKEKAYEAQRLRKEIESYGLFVIIQHNGVIDPNHLILPAPTADIKIEIREPSENLPIEEQKKYDAWFLHIAGICQEDQ